MRPHLIAIAMTAACGGRAEPRTPATTIVLAAPGQAPLRVLRYAPHQAAREVRLHMDVMTFVARVELDSADPVRYRFHGVRMEADPKIYDKMIDEAVAHVSGSIAADVHGRAAAGTDSSAYHTMPELAPVFEEAIVPLPDAPVGVGARWHASGKLSSADSPSTLEVDYELTALTDTEATVHEHGTAKSGTSEATLDLTTTVRFDDLLPLRARIETTAPIPGEAKPISFVFTLD